MEEHPPIQMLSLHMLLYVSTYHGEELSGIARNVSVNQRSAKWVATLFMYDVFSLIAVECGADGVLPKLSEIKHKAAERSMKAACPLEAEEVVGYCYGPLIYCDLCGWKQLMNTYGEGVIAVIVEQFSKW